MAVINWGMQDAGYWEEKRALRDKWLTITDRYLLPDSPLDETQVAELIIYRQSLRDFPSCHLPSDPLPAAPLFIIELNGA